MVSPICKAPMLEGMLLLYPQAISFRAIPRFVSQGWLPELTVPLEEILNVDYKPGGFASGGHINFQCLRGNFEFKVTFSMGQGAQAGVFMTQFEKARIDLKNPVLFSANGVNGQIDLLADRIRIKRAGTLAVLGHGLKGDKDILLSSISSIQFRNPGAMTNGYIQFAFLGGTEAKNALFGATQDENSVMFSAAQATTFLQLKNAIEEQQAKLQQSQSPVPQSVPFSAADELEKLASLRDRGILTEEEFAAKKRQVLGL